MTRDEIFNTLLDLDELGETVLGFIALENISKLSSHDFENRAREIINKYFVDIENTINVLNQKDIEYKLVPATERKVKNGR